MAIFSAHKKENYIKTYQILYKKISKIIKKEWITMYELEDFYDIIKDLIYGNDELDIYEDINNLCQPYFGRYRRFRYLYELDRMQKTQKKLSKKIEEFKEKGPLQIKVTRLWFGSCCPQLFGVTSLYECLDYTNFESYFKDAIKGKFKGKFKKFNIEEKEKIFIKLNNKILKVLKNGKIVINRTIKKIKELDDGYFTSFNINEIFRKQFKE